MDERQLLALFGHRRAVEECLFLEVKQTRPLDLGPYRKLLVPFDRNWLEKIVEPQTCRLPSFQNGFDDLGYEQGQAQHPTEVGFIDGFGFGEVANGCIVAGFQHVTPAMGADDGLDHGAVDP